MAITTWIDENDRQTWAQVHDKDLNELFQEVRDKVSNKYLVQMHVHSYRKHLFAKSKTVYSYSLYVDLGHEAQVINLPQNLEKSSIGTMISKETLMTYFYGVINGFHHFRTNKIV